MAWDDYGGRTYRNGRRVEPRSDAGVERPFGHAVLGDGPIFVALAKQSYVAVHRSSEKLLSIDLSETEAVRPPMRFEIEGHRIEAFRSVEDNHYLYVRAAAPDGVVWHGWSGYGVGEGFDEIEYGFSSAERDRVVRTLWPGDGWE